MPPSPRRLPAAAIIFAIARLGRFLDEVDRNALRHRRSESESVPIRQTDAATRLRLADAPGSGVPWMPYPLRDSPIQTRPTGLLGPGLIVKGRLACTPLKSVARIVAIGRIILDPDDAKPAAWRRLFLAPDARRVGRQQAAVAPEDPEKTGPLIDLDPRSLLELVVGPDIGHDDLVTGVVESFAGIRA